MSSNNNATRHNSNWTTKKNISLSKNLGQAYCLGLDDSKSRKNTDFWTTDKFIEMSRYLSSAYGVDF